MYAVLVLMVMSETRSSIIFARLARDARRVSGDNRVKARIEVERESLLSLIKVACTRPLCTCDVYDYTSHSDLVIQTFSSQSHLFRALALVLRCLINKRLTFL